jgi:hypothetical protein
VDFLQLWDLLSGFELHPGVEDSHIWRLSSGGQYSAKSAYEGFFFGSMLFGHYERIWKTWALAKCRFFLWLVAHNKCWTADRLAWLGLPHPEPEQCPLRDQHDDTINHILISFVFARQGISGTFSFGKSGSMFKLHNLQTVPLIGGVRRQVLL